MATHDITQGRGVTAAASRPTQRDGLHRVATETKAAFKAGRREPYRDGAGDRNAGN
jgi:hypothetical protein